jgi:hypothetical protein
MAKSTKKEKFNLSAIAPDTIIGYWWSVDDGKEQGKYLFYDSLQAAKNGYVDEAGEVHRYYYLNTEIIKDYNRITMLFPSLVEYTKLSDGHILYANGELKAVSQETIANDANWNKTFSERKVSLNKSLDFLHNNYDDALEWVDTVINNKWTKSCRLWDHLTLGDRSKLSTELEEVQKQLNYELQKVNTFYDIYFFEINLFLLLLFKYLNFNHAKNIASSTILDKI